MRSGQLIANRYRLVELVGSGGSGLVWLAEDIREAGRQVALKRPHSVAGPGIRDELEREAGVAARVVHPHAVRVDGLISDDGADGWLVMEYFPSENLGMVLGRGPLEPLAVARIGAEVAGALAAAHEVDVVHRDVTPNNILVGADGTAKITDFGISAYRAQTITTSGKVSGTAVYVSPEVADGKGATAPSDVFSLGASLFAAVEGTPPFGFGEPDAVLARIRDDRRETARRAGPLAPVLDALLRTEKDARPTAAQAAELLTAVVEGRPVTWTPPATRRRRRWPALAGAVALVVVVALLLVFGWPPWGTLGAPAPARTVMGDVRTADPCAVLDPAALRDYGPARIDRHYGNFDRCDVIIDIDGAEMDVVAELAGPRDPEGEPPPGATIQVESPEADAEGACDVTITLTDLTRVDIEARPQDRTDLDTCPIAQAAADRALELLPEGELTRRAEPFDPGSLARLDACDLVDSSGLATLPGLADAVPEPAYGNWACEWDTDEAPMRARVIFDRNVPFDSGDGEFVQLGERQGLVEPRGYGDESCVVNVINRPYRDEHGDEHLELALVVVDGDVSVAELCARAREVAGSVAGNLS